MLGSAIWDDPPKGWGTKRLADYSRGYLAGREVMGFNFGQHFYSIIWALSNPVDFWRRHQLGYLRLCDGADCSCGGFYMTDEKRVGLVCNQCHNFFDYERVRKEEKRIYRRERLERTQQQERSAE